MIPPPTYSMGQDDHLHILLAESDEQRAADICRYADQCEEFRLRIHHQPDPDEALDHLQNQTLHLAFVGKSPSDSISPMDLMGRLHGARPDLPVIVILNSYDPARGAEILDNGAADYISQEHLTEHSLTRSIRHALKQQQLASEHRHVEQKLRKSKRKYRELVENVGNIILRMDSDGTVTFCNQYAVEFFGYTKEELVGQNVLDTIVPDRESTGRDLEEVIEDLCENPDNYATHENENVCKDGERVWVSWTNETIWDPQSQTSEILCVGTDVTDRKEAEEERDDLREQLQQAQKMEAVARLAGGIAHDFNNTLQAVIGFSDLVLQDERLADDLVKPVSEIKKAAECSVDMTRHLLAFARKQTVSPEVVNLNDMLTNMRTMLRSLIGENISLEWSPGADLWDIYVDPGQLNQVITNLAVNSRDAIEGVGTIEIATENVNLSRSFCARHKGCEPGGHVRLSVRDNGQGMDAETQKKVFDPFFTTKEAGKGTGLGLSTVYGIVQQNDAYIDVSSTRREGTTVDIYWPKHSSETTREHADAPEPSVGGNETILLVEDEEAVLNLETSRLEELGYDVLAATGYNQALTRLDHGERDIDLLITDVIMPEMNGSELAEELRKMYPDMKCLYMSGYPDNILSPHGVLGEDTHFIQKPFSQDEIAAKVREVLREEG